MIAANAGSRGFIAVQISQQNIDADMAFHAFRDYACLRVQLSPASHDNGDNMPRESVGTMSTEMSSPFQRLVL